MTHATKEKLKDYTESFRKWGVFVGTVIAVVYTGNNHNNSVDNGGALGKIESKIDHLTIEVAKLSQYIDDSDKVTAIFREDVKKNERALWKAINKLQEGKLANR